MTIFIIILIITIIFLLTTIPTYKNKIQSLENKIKELQKTEWESRKQSLFQNAKYTEHIYSLNSNEFCIEEILIEKNLLKNDNDEIHKWKYKLDEKGNILEEIHCNGKDEIYSILKYFYNNNGKVSKWIDADEEGEDEISGEYFYDNKDRIIRLDRYNSDKKLKNRTTYTYNALGLCIDEEVEYFFVLHKGSNELVNKLDGYPESDLFISKPDKIVYHYDSNGNMIERKFYETFTSFNEKPKTTEKYIYANNKLLEKLSYNVLGLRERSIFGYNADNKEVIEIIENRYLVSSIEVINSFYNKI